MLIEILAIKFCPSTIVPALQSIRFYDNRHIIQGSSERKSTILFPLNESFKFMLGGQERRAQEASKVHRK